MLAVVGLMPQFGSLSIFDQLMVSVSFIFSFSFFMQRRFVPLFFAPSVELMEPLTTKLLICIVYVVIILDSRGVKATVAIVYGPWVGRRRWWSTWSSWRAVATQARCFCAIKYPRLPYSLTWMPTMHPLKRSQKEDFTWIVHSLRKSRWNGMTGERSCQRRRFKWKLVRKNG